MCWPFESRLMTSLELMNESVMLFSLYSVFLFNKLYVTDELFIIDVGYFMISIIVLCMCVHMFFLIKTMALDFYSTVKNLYKRFKNRNSGKARSLPKVKISVKNQELPA